MKLSLLFIGAVFAQDRTIPPTSRLSNIKDGLVEWANLWIPEYKRKTKLDLKLANLV